MKPWLNRRIRRNLGGSASPCADSEELGMLRHRVVLATLLVVVCAACGDDSGAANPAPGASSTASPSSGTPSDGSSDLAGYTADEQTAYDEAVTAYDRFIKRSDGYYAAGETTVEAKQFFQRFAVDWSTAWANLAKVANNDVTVGGTTRTLWTKPRSIELKTAGGDVIVVRRCLDESGRIVKQGGQEVDQPQFEMPHVYTIRLEKWPKEARWRSGIAQLGRTC